MPVAVRAKPSRSRDANQTFAISSGAPTSAKRWAIGVMSDSVSLTSKMTTPGDIMSYFYPLVLPLSGAGERDRRRPTGCRLWGGRKVLQCLLAGGGVLVGGSVVPGIEACCLGVADELHTVDGFGPVVTVSRPGAFRVGSSPVDSGSGRSWRGRRWRTPVYRSVPRKNLLDLAPDWTVYVRYRQVGTALWEESREARATVLR